MEVITEELSLVSRIRDLADDIKKFIESEEWIFYFANSDSPRCTEALTLLIEHPTDWRNYTSFAVTCICDSTVLVTVTIKDCKSEIGTCFDGTIFLASFKETVECNRKGFKGLSYVKQRAVELAGEILQLKAELNSKNEELKRLTEELKASKERY